MNLRSDRVAQSGEVEVGVERGVDLDAAVHDALLSSLNGGLGVGRGILVVVLVGHDADTALCEAELDFTAPVGLTGIPLVEDPASNTFN